MVTLISLLVKEMLMKKSMSNEASYSVAMGKAIIEDTQDIMGYIQSNEVELPLWWTNKLAVSSAYLNSLRDYIMFSCCSDEEGEIEIEDEESDEQEEVTEESESEDEDELVDTPIEAEVEYESVDEYMLPPSARMMRNAT